MDEESSGSSLKFWFTIIGLVIVAITITIIALYFTCTWPFNSSDSCICTKSGGTYDSKKCKCPSTKIINDGVCEDCPTGEIPSGDICNCPDGTLRDSDKKCKTSSVYKTNNYGNVLCPTSFSTTYTDNVYANDKICNKTTRLCDACVTTNEIYPTTYMKMGQLMDWPIRLWGDPMDDGVDIRPTCTDGRTMGYAGGTYITTAMPLNC